MKIAIYGDSFAASNGPTSWTSILKTKFDTTVYALGGSSLFWSYKNFIATYKNFDTIIFLVTDFGRLYVADKNIAHAVCNLFCVEHSLKTSLDASLFNIFNAAKQYYTYLQEEEYELSMHYLMIEKIQNLCKESNKKLILVPCMWSSLRPEFTDIFDSTFCLSDINNKEREHFGVPHEGMFAERKDRLQNHISDDNNLILANIMTDLIEGHQLKVDINNFNHRPDNVEIYYDMEKLKSIK